MSPSPAAAPASPPDPASLWAALAAVQDPELGESIVELGLVERLEALDGQIALTLVPTSATCPMADVLMDDAAEALEAVLPPGWVVDVTMDFGVAWTPERLSPALKDRFGW